MSLGVWHGAYRPREVELDWLRWWGSDGQMLPIGKEVARQERDRVEQEKQRAEQAEEREVLARQEAAQEREKAARLAERLRALGVDPEDL